MNKLFAVLLAAGLSIPAYAEQVVTPNASGDNPFIEYAGVLTARITNTQGTVGTLVSSSPVIVYGISISSVASTTYVQLFSTNSITLLSGVPKLTQFAPGTGTTSSKLAQPVRFPLGLVAKTNAAVEVGTQSEIVILYRIAN
jgi:hypothetical protein